MPVIIRELLITAAVDTNQAQQTTAAATKPADAQKKLIEACVEQVLAILQEKNER